MSSNSDLAISVKGLSKCYQIYEKPHHRLLQMLWHGRRQYYREFWALKDVSFEIKKGETVGIIGRNGSGKSTLLQMICGTLNPTCGEIHTTGRIAALLELGSGFNPEFTGRENVFMNASILGLQKDEIIARFNDIENFADIGDFINQPVKTYSSGMLVRLAFAVIAHVDADILIIDEALAVGDAFFTQKCMRFLRNFMSQGTILFVSHDTGAVINLCQKAIWLNMGKLKEAGEPKDLAQHYLAELYESQQGESVLSSNSSDDQNRENSSLIDTNNPQSDPRINNINSTQYRNDIQLFTFNQDAPNFGKGGGEIRSVQLFNKNGDLLNWLIGGESVSLFIKCHALKDICSPIVGFYISDRLGQALFGDNTFNFSQSTPLYVIAGKDFIAKFDFIFPILPSGDYTITVALAEGTQSDHIQHHWIYDAIQLKSHSSSVSTGLVGIPMNSIQLQLL